MTQHKITEILRIKYRTGVLVAELGENPTDPGHVWLQLGMWSKGERTIRRYVGRYPTPFSWALVQVADVNEALDYVQCETNAKVAEMLIRRFWAEPKA